MFLRLYIGGGGRGHSPLVLVDVLVLLVLRVCRFRVLGSWALGSQGPAMSRSPSSEKKSFPFGYSVPRPPGRSGGSRSSRNRKVSGSLRPIPRVRGDREVRDHRCLAAASANPTRTLVRVAGEPATRTSLHVCPFSSKSVHFYLDGRDHQASDAENSHEPIRMIILCIRCHS